jgi:hypothetical protein
MQAQILKMMCPKWRLKELNSRILTKIRDSKILKMCTLTSLRNLRWPDCHIIIVSSARSLTLEDSSLARMLKKRRNKEKTSSLTNWFVGNAQLCLWEEVRRLVRSMATTSLNLSVSSAAMCRSGSVGATLISATAVTRSRITEIT